MTSDDVAKTSDFVAAPSVLPAGVRTKIFIYLGFLVVLLGLPGGLIGLPISLILWAALVAVVLGAYRLIFGG